MEDDLLCPLCKNKLSSEDYNSVIEKCEKDAQTRTQEIVENTKETYNQKLEEAKIKIQEQESQKQNIEMEKQTDELSQMSVDMEHLKQEIGKKNAEIEVRDQQFEDYKKKQNQKPAWLQGKIGEMNLLKKLSDAFPSDQFESEKPGIEEADIVQRIHTGTQFLDTTICYDNKEGKRILPSDIVKAKNYKNIHNTSNVIIVSTALPAGSNQGITHKNDVLIVHPFIITEIAALVRDSLIAIASIAKSEVDKSKKEAALYEYMMGESFRNQMQLVYTAHKDLNELQEKEEKEHAKMWKKRKRAVSQMVKSFQQLEENVRDISQQDFLKHIS